MDTTQEDPQTFQRCKQMLEANQIEFKLFEHIPVQTSEEAAKLRGVTMASGAKAMLLWRKSKNANDVDPNSFILTVMSAEKKLSWSIIRQELSCKQLTMASAAQVKAITGCLPGAVPPFGSAFNVQTYLDPSLIDQGETINFNVGLRTHSVTMKVKDYLEIEKPIVLKFVE